ncbi:MAG: cell division protein ZapD [Burkholderiales bacterium]|uniref:cell division protein ZapD n=1 Tax=Inhella sp. TaxID=1921806 RepID=UPI001AC87308|nr:cell division protein ZapD [Burkholderiales bacterium]
MLLYEFPFNESTRTLLRLEHLFDRLGQLVQRDAALDHHFALATLFEIVELALRTDLKGDLMKDIDRQRAQYNAYRGNPAVAQEALEQVCSRLDRAFADLNALQGKPGHQLSAHEMLNGLKNRIGMPGGTCEFDLPAYHAWQQRDGAQRRQDLLQWMAPVMPLAQGVSLLLSLLRETGVPHKVAAVAGQFQQSLGSGKPSLLARLRIDPALGLVPEISGHRLMILVRLMRIDADGRSKLAADQDVSLELSLCA